jgi:hypothetical protein
VQAGKKKKISSKTEGQYIEDDNSNVVIENKLKN